MYVVVVVVAVTAPAIPADVADEICCQLSCALHPSTVARGPSGWVLSGTI
jgi:hypothetical protein